MQQVAIGRITRLIQTHKAKAAFLAPFILSLGGVVTSWIATGDWNEAETRTILGGMISAIIASVATWLVPAGDAEVVIEPGSVEIFDNGLDDDETPGIGTEALEDEEEHRGMPMGFEIDPEKEK